jgi:phage-related protein
VSVWGSITGYLSGAWAGISEAATTTWTTMSGFFTTIMEGIKLAFSTAWEGIKGTWTAVADWFQTTVIDPITKAFQAFQTTIIGVWDAIWAGIKGVINSILGGVESFVNGIVRGVNLLIGSLNDAIALGSEVTEALGLGSIGPITPWSTVSLPRLAQGAVIPPNREFAAILGDQRSGVNIETPLDTMVEAFKAALGDMGGGGNNQPIYITVESTLDGKTIARNQARYLPKEYGRIGASAVRVGGLA